MISRVSELERLHEILSPPEYYARGPCVLQVMRVLQPTASRTLTPGFGTLGALSNQTHSSVLRMAFANVNASR